MPGTSTGPLIQRALVDQFSRLRDGDSFWYQRVFSGAQLAELNNTKLTDIIARNTEINNLQNSAFFFRVAVNGRVFNDVNWNGVCDSGEHGLNNRTLELLNEDGEVIATTTTDNQGYFNYDVLDGLGLGEYVVRQVMPNGWQCTTQPALEVTLTRGEQFMAMATSAAGSAAEFSSLVNTADSVTADTVMPLRLSSVCSFSRAAASRERIVPLGQPSNRAASSVVWPDT